MRIPGVWSLAASLFFSITASAGAANALVEDSKITLGEILGRIDHLAYDPARGRLYVAELGNNSVGIVDLKSQKLIRTVGGFAEPQGIAYEPSTDTIFVASGGDGSLQMFAGSDFTTLGKIILGADADNVRVDTASRRVYVGYGNGAIAVVDAVARKRIADIPLRGHPESFQLESNGPRIFVNVPDAKLIQAVSRDTNLPTGNWSTKDLQANYPLVVDAPNQRVLAVFRHPARLEAFDMAVGKRLVGVDTCGDADDVFVDAVRDRVYVICGEGTVDTYAPAGDSFVRVSQFNTRPGSRTGLYLPDIDRLAVAVRASGKEQAAVWLLRPSPTTEGRPGLIVMVCEHGNVKSLMAASYFNELASARHLPFHAIARGTAPNSTTVPPPIIDGLRSDGFDVAGFHPAAVSDVDVAAADRVILINAELAANISDAARPPEKWTDVPPASVDYDAARKSLKSHVRALVDQLAQSK